MGVWLGVMICIARAARQLQYIRARSYIEAIDSNHSGDAMNRLVQPLFARVARYLINCCVNYPEPVEGANQDTTIRTERNMGGGKK